MDRIQTAAYQASADLNFWFKITSGDPLALSDIPEIIPLRWTYFRDNWEFIKPQIKKLVPSYFDPDFLNDQINQFSDFISKQRFDVVNPFSDNSTFFTFYAIFDNILIENINITNDENNFITDKTATISAYSKNDFLRIKNDLIAQRDKLADIGGLGDASYNASADRNAIPAQTVASITDLNLMLSIQEDIKAVDFVLANLFAIDTAIDPFALAIANANNPDVDIGQYNSGKLVRMNYGDDLESLAYTYLNDANKWIDIAIANGLKPPYIDEVGQKLNLIANGSGNQINIAQSDLQGNLNIDKFYINQVIFVQSNAQRFPDQRTIIDIKQIPVSGEIVLLLDGDANLDQYRLADQANIRVFAPNTINSSYFILIPSTEALPDQRFDELPWFLASSAEDEKRAKIDLAIDTNGEINFTSNGDLNLSYGLANAVQAMKLKIITELGSLRYHPNYGLVNIIGSKNDNIEDIKDLLVNSINTQILADSRFDRVESISVDYLVSDSSVTAASAMSITMSVRLAGGSTVIPISFTVAK